MSANSGLRHRGSDGRQNAGEVRQTVLIVEDEDILRELASRVLRQAGYLVLEACRAEDAIEAVRTDVGRLDLLVSDISLPQVSGLLLFEDLRRWNDGLKALFISGYPEEALPSMGGIPAGAAFLGKPFENRDLLGRYAGCWDHPILFAKLRHASGTFPE